MCVGVAARRGAVCSTDHHLMCAKFRFVGRRCVWQCGIRAKGKGFDVGKLALGKDREESAVRHEYLEKTRGVCSADGGVDELWSAMQFALVTTAEDVLGRAGRAGRTQLDRFRDSLEELKPLLQHRHATYSKWLGSGKQEDLIVFKEAGVDIL